MIINLIQYAFSSEEFSSPSDFSIEESISRLNSRLADQSKDKNGKFFIGKSKIIGNVYNDQVYLRRPMTMVSNPYKVVFKGKFIEKNGRVSLDGKFTMFWFGKVLAFICCILSAAISLLVFASTASYILINIIQSLSLTALCFAVFIFLTLSNIAFGKWLGKDDKSVMQEFIQKSLLKSYE